jgi:AcrR family transcriptional regulator
LRAARVRFAADGYQNATIRKIAADADIDPSMVMRYYGNKAGLFAAAVDVDLRLPVLADVGRSRLGETLVRHFLSRWEGEPGNGALLMLLRSAATDESVARLTRTIFLDQLLPVVGTVVKDHDEAAERAGLISAQMLGLALCRGILRLPSVVAMTADDVVAWIGPTIQRYLTGEPAGRAD